MGTKANPGKFDCYAAAQPDEPIFTLLGRDLDAPAAIQKWTELRLERINRGEKPRTELGKVDEARRIAADMTAFQSNYVPDGRGTDAVVEHKGRVIDWRRVKGSNNLRIITGKFIDKPETIGTGALISIEGHVALCSDGRYELIGNEVEA